MSDLNTSVSLYGAVPQKIGEKEVVSLTGSATILRIGGKKYLIDLGLFQGGEGAELYNKENITFLNNIDGVIITHSHVDHIGRLPLLFKLGFKGPIFMTSATKSITSEMLEDSFKIQEGDKIERLNRNKKLGFRLREALKIKESIISIKRNNFINQDDKQSLKSFLEKKLGKEDNYDDVLSKTSDYLNFYGVKEEYDIEAVINKLKENLFNLEDISGVMGLVQTLEHGEEKIVSSKQITSKNSNTEDQDLLDNLPQRIAEGYKGKISVNFKSEKRDLKNKWEQALNNNIQNVIKQSGGDFEKEKESLRKKLESAFTFCEQYSYLKDDQYKKRKEYGPIKKHIIISEKILKSFGVINRGDIDKILDDKKKLIDIFKINIPFNSDNIKEANNLLQINNKSNNERKVIGLTYSDAAHIVGAASVTLTSGIVKNRVKNLLDINGEATSIYFSGDLGRIENNRLGRPEIPPLPVDYLQIESTYGGRNHRDRLESVDDLINSIEDSEGNVLISVFSQQRTQEILLTILEEKIKRGIDCLDYDILVDAPLGEKVTNIYFYYMGETYNLLSEKSQIELFGKVVFRFLEMDEWEDIYSKKEINEIKSISKLNILTDKRLIDLTIEKKEKLQLYINNINEILSSNKSSDTLKSNNTSLSSINEVEIKLYLEVIKEILGEKLYIQIINNKEDIKHVILASSGMMDGGAIMNHLTCILGDKDATILAPGYLSRGTLGNDIVMGNNKYVTISGIKYKINCNKKFIDGFSSHIGHDEILQFLTESIKEGKLKSGSTIALTHGNIEGQESLKKDILEILKGFNREDIKITIPDLFSHYNIGNNEFSSLLLDDVAIKKVSNEKICIIPDFLLGNNNVEITEIENKESEEEGELKLLNINNINNIKKQGNKINQYKDSFVLQYLSQKLKEIGLSDTNKMINVINKLGLWQRKIFFDTIDKKIIRNKTLKSNISTLKNQKVNFKETYNKILDLYGELFDFYKYEKQSILLDIENIENIINKLENEKQVLESNFLEYKKNNPKKTSNNFELWQEYTDGINNIKKSLQLKKKSKKGKETVIKSFLNMIEKGFNNSINNFKIQTVCKSYIESFKNDTLLNIDNIEKKLEIVFDEAKLDISTDITILQSELDSNVDISFMARNKNFGGKNLYKELYDNDSNELDLDILQGLITDNFFSEEEEFIINGYIEKILGKKIKEIKMASKALKKYFQNKKNENNDLGINGIVSIEELNKKYLYILGELFNKDYFNEFIGINFNIYFFLKSQMSFRDYIINKYNLLKLKGIGEDLKVYNTTINNLEYLIGMLDGLEQSNNDTVGMTALFDIQHLIDLTGKEIDNVLNKFNK